MSIGALMANLQAAVERQKALEPPPSAPAGASAVRELPEKAPAKP
jgi:hypothetical protein